MDGASKNGHEVVGASWGQKRGSTGFSNPQPMFQLSSAECLGGPEPLALLLNRPVALLSLVPRPVVLFAAGAVAGALGKTVTAPLDRVKILLQVKGGLQEGAVRAAAQTGSMLSSLTAIAKEEGIFGFWKGNFPQVIRVLPYSAAQLGSYELIKQGLKDENGELPLSKRFIAGACAGMFSTLVTYPLDTLRLRLAVDPNVRTLSCACGALYKEGGIAAFFRGLGPALIGIAPYMALELAAFDSMPNEIPSFYRGFGAALIATSFCYPLDTIRRSIQLQSRDGLLIKDAFSNIVRQDGPFGFYRGFLPNAAKNLPNKGIRLSTFDAVKGLLQESEKAYHEESAALQTKRFTGL